MTIYELRQLFVDDDFEIRVYDCANDCETVYTGSINDIPYELEDIEIISIDHPITYKDYGYIGINVELEEDEDF